MSSDKVTKAELASEKRWKLLDIYFHSLFEFFVSIGEETWSYLFASMMLQSMLNYMTEADFLKSYPIEVGTRWYLKQKRNEANGVYEGLFGILGGNMSIVDRKMFRNFPGIMTLEGILSIQARDILGMVYFRSKQYAKDVRERALDIHERRREIDQWISLNMDRLMHIHSGNLYVKQLFAATLIRFVFLQLMTTDEENIDEEILAFLKIKHQELAAFASGSAHAGRHQISNGEFFLLVHHPKIFLPLSLMDESGGMKLIRLLTVPDDEIMWLEYDDI